MLPRPIAALSHVTVGSQRSPLHPRQFNLLEYVHGTKHRRHERCKGTGRRERRARSAAIRVFCAIYGVERALELHRRLVLHLAVEYVSQLAGGVVEEGALLC